MTCENPTSFFCEIKVKILIIVSKTVEGNETSPIQVYE